MEPMCNFLSVLSVNYVVIAVNHFTPVTSNYGLTI